MRATLWKAFAITALLLAALMFLSGDAAYKTAARAHNFLFPSYKQEFVKYTVAHGDTIYGIAKKYAGQQDKYDDLRGIVDDIHDANGISYNDAKWLTPGRQLTVPLYKEI